jgi:hypothetical protein
MIGDISVRRVAGKLHFAVHQQSFVDMLPQVRVICSTAVLLAQSSSAGHAFKEGPVKPMHMQQTRVDMGMC